MKPLRAFNLICLMISVAFTASPAAWSAETKSPFSLQAEVGGKLLGLHGVGDRKATIFAVKVYQAAFYAARDLHTLEEVLANPDPKRLDVQYVRNFSLEDTVKAWRYQFTESAGLKPGELTPEIDALVSFQKPIQEGDIQRFDLIGTKTLFFINGEKRGEILGAPFQRAFLTIFFGPNPPTRDLQRDLYRGIRPLPPSPLPTSGEKP